MTRRKPTEQNAAPEMLTVIPVFDRGQAWVQRYDDIGIPDMVYAAGVSESEKRKDGLTNYEHALAVGSIIAGNTSIAIRQVPALQLAVMVHDTIAPRDGRPAKSFKGQSPMEYGDLTHRMLGALAQYTNETLGDEADPEVKGQFLNRVEKAVEVFYALGVATSANMWEQAGESWRKIIYDKILSGKIGGELGFIDQQIEEIAKEQGSAADDPESKILKFRREILIALETGKADVSPALLNFRAPRLDFYQVFNEFANNYDLEGLVVKSAEVIFNLMPEHRNPERPASAWRDAQELLSLYGPLLEALGFDDMAALAYGTANEYLMQNSVFVNEARKLHMKGADYWYGPSPQQGADMRTLVIGKVNKANQGVQVINDRVKHVGSIVEKMEAGRGAPDLIGIRARISDPPTNEPEAVKKHMMAHVAMLEKELSDLGFELGDNRGMEPVEIRHRALEKGTQKKRTASKARRLPVKTDEPILDGYEGTHVLFVNKNDPDILMEVQLVTRSQDQVRTGIASHLFYKMTNAIGPLGDARRALNNAVKEKKQAFTPPAGKRASSKWQEPDPAPFDAEIRSRRAAFGVQKNRILQLMYMYSPRLYRFAGDVEDYRYYLNAGTVKLMTNKLSADLAKFGWLEEILDALSIKPLFREV